MDNTKTRLADLMREIVVGDYYWIVADDFLLISSYEGTPIISQSFIDKVTEIKPVQHTLVMDNRLILCFSNSGIHNNYWKFIYDKTLSRELGIITNFSEYWTKDKGTMESIYLNGKRFAERLKAKLID